MLLHKNYASRKNCASRAWWISPAAYMVIWILQKFSNLGSILPTKKPRKILWFLYRFSYFQNCYLIFNTEFTWKSFEDHFQIYNWLAEPKHLQAMFLDFCERNGGFTIFWLLQKNFQNWEFVLVGLTPGKWRFRWPPFRITFHGAKLFSGIGINNWKLAICTWNNIVIFKFQSLHAPRIQMVRINRALNGLCFTCHLNPGQKYPRFKCF
jgi:hypothetical protein